jgi:hypothetical protein
MMSTQFLSTQMSIYYDTGTPYASLAPYGVFRQVLNHVTVMINSNSNYQAAMLTGTTGRSVSAGRSLRCSSFVLNPERASAAE